MVAKAAPDGYTLLLASQTNAISATLYKKLNFDPIEDFVGISLLGREPGALVVHPSTPVKNVAELIAYAKARPGEVNYASSGNGSGQHLFMAMFESMAGLKLTHVPYKGSGQATTDLLAGTIPMSFPGANGMMKHVRSGKLRVVATSGVSRSALLPDVPTLSELGLTGDEAGSWYGLLVPAGTPEAIVRRINAESVKALRGGSVRDSLSNEGAEVIGSTPEEFARHIRAEHARVGKMLKDGRLKMEQ